MEALRREVLLDGKNAYNSKDAATWLEDFWDYLSGCTPLLDGLFAWAELQPTEILRATEYSAVSAARPRGRQPKAVGIDRRPGEGRRLGDEQTLFTGGGSD